jgi:hypothetical protein
MSYLYSPAAELAEAWYYLVVCCFVFRFGGNQIKISVTQVPHAGNKRRLLAFFGIVVSIIAGKRISLHCKATVLLLRLSGRL